MRTVSISDRYEATEGTVLLSGIEALVRLLLTQRRLDRLRNLSTAAVHQRLRRVAAGRSRPAARAGRTTLLADADIVFAPGLNEELAATAVGGTQLTGELPGRRVDGVVGFWFGKNPGLDRAADAIRHASVSGTAPLGGAVAARGRRPALEVLHPAQFVRADGSGAGRAGSRPVLGRRHHPPGTPCRGALALCRSVGRPENSGRHRRRQRHRHHPGPWERWAFRRPTSPASGIRARLGRTGRRWRPRRTSSTCASPGSTSTPRWPGSTASPASPSAPAWPSSPRACRTPPPQRALSDLGLERA